VYVADVSLLLRPETDLFQDCENRKTLAEIIRITRMRAKKRGISCKKEGLVIFLFPVVKKNITGSLKDIFNW